MLRVGVMTSFFPPQVGGIPSVLSVLLPTLANREIKFVVAVGDDISDEWRSPHIEVVRLREMSNYRRMFTEYIAGRTDDWKSVETCCVDTASSVGEIFQGYHVDLVHGHTNYELGQEVAERIRVPFIPTFHNAPLSRKQIEAAGGSSFLRNDVMLGLSTRVRASAAIAVTQYGRRRWLEAGFDCPVFEAIHNPVASTYFSPISSQEGVEARHALGIGLEERVICFAQRPVKPGMIGMFRAFGSVAGRLRDVRLLLCGSDTVPQALRSELEHLGLAGRVTCRKFDWPRMRDAYAVADAVVLPNALEGFGMPAIEALACGVPVVAPAAPVFLEILGGIPGALLYEPSHAPSFAARLEEALADRSIASAAAAGAFIVRTRFDAESAGAAHLRVYETACGQAS